MQTFFYLRRLARLPWVEEAFAVHPLWLRYTRPRCGSHSFLSIFFGHSLPPREAKWTLEDMTIITKDSLSFFLLLLLFPVEQRKSSNANDRVMPNWQLCKFSGTRSPQWPIFSAVGRQIEPPFFCAKKESRLEFLFPYYIPRELQRAHVCWLLGDVRQVMGRRQEKCCRNNMSHLVLP